MPCMAPICVSLREFLVPQVARLDDVGKEFNGLFIIPCLKGGNRVVEFRIPGSEQQDANESRSQGEKPI